MTIPVDQIWAQAVALYRAGESWRLLPEEAGHQTHQNEQYEVETPLEAWIAHAFLFTGNSEDRITMADVYFQLGEHIRENQRTRNEISAVLRKFGAERGRTGRARYYQGVRIRHSEEQLPTMVDSLVSTVTPGDRLQSPPDSAAE
jgi:predicted P-loop ATPase